MRLPVWEEMWDALGVGAWHAKEMSRGRSATCGVSVFHSSKAQFRAGYPREQPGLSWEESKVTGDDQAKIQSQEVSFGSWC